MDPSSLRILVVDSKGSSRQLVCSLLRDCAYQVTPVRTGKEALQLLAAHTHDAPAYDLILKEHEPPGANAVRLLRKLTNGVHTRCIPVVVMSTQDDREIVATCLNRGATDYLIKPLRHNELRHIWTRVWWWQRNKEQSRQNIGHYLPYVPYDYPDNSLSSISSDGTKCSDDEDEPTSKEGSAPDGNAVHGSNNNGNGSNGSKEGNGTSRVDAKPHGGGGSNGEGGSNNGDGSNGNGNGSSDNKHGNGSSDNKHGNGNGSSDNKTGGHHHHQHHGSNGNGASTTVHAARRGSHALAGTAEGRAKPSDLVQDDPALPPKSARAGSAFAHYLGPSTTSRKRPASELGLLASGRDSNQEAARQQEQQHAHACHQHQQAAALHAHQHQQACAAQQQRRQAPSHSHSHRERLPMRCSTCTAGAQPSAAHTASEEATHLHPHAGSHQRSSAHLQAEFGQPSSSNPHFGQLHAGLGGRAAGHLPWSRPPLLPVAGAAGQGGGHAVQHAFGIYPTPSHFGVIQNSIHPLTLYSNSPALSGHHSGHHSGHPPGSLPSGQASLEQQALPRMAAPALGFLNPEQLLVAEAAAANLVQSRQAAAATTALASNPQLGAMLLNQLLQLNHSLNAPQPAPQQLQPAQQPQGQRQQQLVQAQGQGQQVHSTQDQAQGQAPALQQLLQQQQPAPSATPGSLTASWRPQVPAPVPQAAGLSGGAPPGAAPLGSSFASGGAAGTGINGSNGGMHSSRAERDSRQLALDKYRNKRKNLKFGKTIRYESRKALAQQRPRIKGQFVKHSQQGSSQGKAGTGGEDSTGGAGGRSRGLSARYWQNGSLGAGGEGGGCTQEELEDEEYDRDDELDAPDEDEEEQGAAQLPGQARGQDHQEAPNEDELDVVDSLRELQRQASVQRQAGMSRPAQAAGRASSPAGGGAEGGGGGPGKAGHPSRGSHGHGARPHCQLYQRSTQASNDTRTQLAGDLQQRDSQRAAQEGSAGNAKNGSDSGSNSPDDNARGQKAGGHHIGHGHGHGHKHRYEH